MTYFKQDVQDLGDIKAGSTDVPIEWEFGSIKKSDIAFYLDSNGDLQPAIKKSCGCTAKIEVLDDRIKAKYTDTLKKGIKSKTLTIYLKPRSTETPIRVKNEKGIETYNADLEKVIVSFKLKSI